MVIKVIITNSKYLKHLATKYQKGIKPQDFF